MRVFCDWLSIYQVYPEGGLPIVNSGRVVSVDSDGAVQWQTSARAIVEGSHSTTVNISCDGYRVTLSGNVSRFDRPDNVFGYSVLECVSIANKILAMFYLPPFLFSKGQILSDDTFVCGGAVITRVDLTCNFETGSPSNAEAMIKWASGQKMITKEPRAYGITGVTWGEGSRLWYGKLYDKAADYLRHKSRGAEVDHELYNWLRDSGVVRLELGLKSMFLKNKNLWRLNSWVRADGATTSVEYGVFEVFMSELIGGVAVVENLLNLPGRLGEIALAWQSGADMRKRFSSRATFYRWRKKLLSYGIDIEVPCRFDRELTSVRLVELRPAAVPSFYAMPFVQPLRLAA